MDNFKFTIYLADQKSIQIIIALDGQSIWMCMKIICCEALRTVACDFTSEGLFKIKPVFRGILYSINKKLGLCL